MDRTGDLGGTRGWGPVREPDPAEPAFAQPWEGRAFALTVLAMGRISGRNVDAFRHALDRLDRAAYLGDGYYGRWLAAAELMLTDSAILAPGAVDARARALAGDHVTEPPAPEPDRPDYAPAGPGSLRSVQHIPGFTAGDIVRAKDLDPPGHTRLPRYVRGRTGVVELVQPAHVLPDTHAHLAGEHPQHVYSVRFTSRELWGTDVDAFAVTVELYESYLEPA